MSVSGTGFAVKIAVIIEGVGGVSGGGLGFEGGGTSLLAGTGVAVRAEGVFGGGRIVASSNSAFNARGGVGIEDFGVVFGFGVAETLAVAEVALEVGTGEIRVGGVIEAGGFTTSGAVVGGGATEGIAEEVAKEAGDSAENGSRHLHEGEGEEERENLDGDTKDDPEGVAVGARDEGPAGEAGGAKEKAKHGVEDEHLFEDVEPFFEPRLSIGEKIGDESEWRDHNEESDDGLAERDSEEANDEGDEAANNDGNEHPEEGTKATTEADGEASDGAAGSEGDEEVGDRNIDGGGGLSGSGGGGDTVEEATKAGTDNVASVNGEGANEEGEVDKNGGDDDARKGLFDAIVTKAEAGDLGVDDDENEDDEENVTDVAGIFPDGVDGRGIIGGEGLDGEEIFDEAIEGVDGLGGEVGDGADEPTDAASLVIAGGFESISVIFSRLIGVGGLVGSSGSSLFGGVGFRSFSGGFGSLVIGGIRFGVNRGGRSEGESAGSKNQPEERDEEKLFEFVE